MLVIIKHWGQTIFSLMLLLSVSGVVAAKSERDKYEDLQDGFFYKMYNTLSRETIRGITDVYNIQPPGYEHDTLSRGRVHALLGLMWSMGLDDEYAIADSQLALNKADEMKEKYIAHSIMSLAFYNKGWVSLAREQSALLKQPEFAGYEQKYEQEALVANLIVGSLAIREGDLATTQHTFSKVAQATDKPWVETLAKTAALSMNGSILDAISSLKALALDPTLTSAEREQVMSLLAETEQQQGKSELSSADKTSITRQVGQVLFNQVEQQGQSSVKGLISDLRTYTQSVDL